jgi:hypothetical protein
MDGFFEAFNASNKEAQRVMGEPWQLVDAEGVAQDYQAIDISNLTVQETTQQGGKYQNATATITLLQSVVTRSGVKEGSVLVAYRQRLRVQKLGLGGDNSIELICGPVGVRMQKF